MSLVRRLASTSALISPRYTTPLLFIRRPATLAADSSRRARRRAAAPVTAAAPQKPLLHMEAVALARNGVAVPCEVAAGPWLAQSPRGAYTTARTVGGGTRVFELSHHISRLASSILLMMEADCQEGKPGAEALLRKHAHLTDPSRLRPLVIASLSAAISAYRQEAAAGGDAAFVAPALQCLVAAAQQGAQEPALAVAAAAGAAGLHTGQPAAEQALAVAAASPSAPAAAAEGPAADGAAAQAQQELKLTVLVTWGQEGADIYAHVCALPPRPRPPVKVQVRGAPRSNALAKDSEWVRQRKALEAGKPADVNEVLLVEASGEVLEGTSSNFFAVVGGAVHTAGAGVLEGTVRTVALEVARREGIPLVLRPPSLQELDQWEGAFISSTSRLVLPIDELSVPDWPSGPLTKRWPRGGLVSRLEQLVLQEVEAHSEPLE